MSLSTIPAKTQAELRSPAPKGERHAQMVRVATSLHHSGINPDAAFLQLRSMYANDVSDSEIRNLISWVNQTVIPSAPKVKPTPFKYQAETKSPEFEIKRFLKGFDCSEADLFEISPCRPLEDWRVDSMMLIAELYSANEIINIVTTFFEREGKACPVGKGVSLNRNDWMRHIRDRGTPTSKAGAWMRMNPVDGTGVADTNVTAYRFALIEFDSVPVALQLPLLARLPLPISAILTSGGRSLHAWVRIEATDIDSYRETVSAILNILKRFGADISNKNPSRLSRLVGTVRAIGAVGDGRQRLIYLNPDKSIEGAIL